MSKARIQIAKPDIIEYFENSEKKIFKSSEISGVLESNRKFWRLTQSQTLKSFVEFLLNTGRMNRIDLDFSYYKTVRYAWGQIPTYSLLDKIMQNGFYSHYTAIDMHGLTEQSPKTVFINIEQPPKPHPIADLEQSRIDLALSRKVRTTNNCIDFRDYRVCLISGKNTGRLGVSEIQGPDEDIVDVTNIERTLIDIAVRPVYSGGIFEVLKAYKNAQGTVSVNRMAAMLSKMNYIYPYHQVIGYYLDRAGNYKESAVGIFDQIPKKFDFYLTHRMGKTKYIDKWRLFVPEEF